MNRQAAKNTKRPGAVHSMGNFIHNGIMIASGSATLICHEDG
jgi:hypothetical protein